MFNGPVFLNETIQANARAVNAGGISESLDEANALYSRLSGASFKLVPSSFGRGVLYSGAPGANGDLSWTRGSDAFRTNASGVLQRVPWNLLQQSETFDNAVWTKFDTTVTANASIAPNGTTTADKLIETATTNVHWLFQSTTTTSSLAMSCYMKKGERDWGLIRTRTASGDRFAWFNLNTGVVGTVESGITASITNVGDGWYRCVVVNPNPTTSANPSVIGLSNADNVSTYTGDGTSGIYIWGAQLVEGTTAQTYLPTTDRLNFPRLSYMYGSCPSALLEPQRTNTLLYSNDFTNASWVKDNSGATNPVVTANYGTSPDGSNNASRLQLNKTGGIFSRIKQSVTTSGVYTFTVWMKSNTGASQNVGLRLEGTGINCVVTTSWQRFQVTTTVAISAESQILLYDLISGNDETADILIYGAQTELGAYPTTYIPTTSATATRVADSFSRNNIYTNGLISASGGTWFVELRNNIVYTRDTASYGLAISDQSTPSIGGGASGNTLAIIRTSTSSVRLQIIKQESLTFTSLYTTLTDTVKIAIKWNGATADVFVNGTKQVSGTTFTTTTLQNLVCLATDVPRFIQQMALFPTPLSDTDCASLTADYTDGTSIVGDYERYVSQRSGAVENLSGVTNLIQNLK